MVGYKNDPEKKKKERKKSMALPYTNKKYAEKKK